MTKPHLRPCPACARHMRATEPACPFCGASVDPAFAASPAPLAPAARLSRAALFAIGTGTISLTAACGGIASESTTRGDAGGSDAAMTASPEGGDDDYDAGNFAVPYGIAPPPVDSGIDADDTAPNDAGSPDAADAHVVILPPYGLPPTPQ